MEVAATIQHNCAVMVGLCTARYERLLPCHIAFTFSLTENSPQLRRSLIWTSPPRRPRYALHANVPLVRNIAGSAGGLTRRWPGGTMLSIVVSPASQ